MSKRLPVITGRKLIRVLEKKGWRLDRVRGSHHIFLHPNIPGRVVVPVHGREVQRGTLLSILEAAGITRDELRDLI